MPLARIPLSTGVELDVAIAGDPGTPPIILLHGFPESHRTWRHQIPALAGDHYVIAPDQRGYARSSKPEGIAAYAPDRIVGDLMALADHLNLARFTLVGHDWGGAIAWMAALGRPDRVERLAIVNAPHPFLFQRALFDVPEQRAAGQYIRAFRGGLEAHVERIGLSAFLDEVFSRHVDPTRMAGEKPAYLDEWSQPGAMTAMLNWYRASRVIVPAPGEHRSRPALLDAPFPPVIQPTLVIWGMDDPALLAEPNLDGLETLVPDLAVERLDGVGHFAPWEAPERVTAILRAWLAEKDGRAG
ncbi:alpha/beta fold hydrolase [Sphingomonas bacterium]|uniref:alpha/beta fold hydrolase n=1 Tax=Sphingomonas bacterium TaxID=1895847 RepID=UPI001575BF66|nr:alpha/beta hydrolase [Sphingomonas bacterium]